MNELSIVLGLIIIMTGYIIYSRNNYISECDNYIAYFDKMYYDMPKLQTIKPETINPETINYKESLNDMNNIKQQQRIVKNVGDDTNIMASRWSSNVELHDRNSVGSCEYTNTDCQVTPTYLQHHLKTSTDKISTDTGNRKSHAESFADDEWLDTEFSYNDKYSYNKDDDDIQSELIALSDSTFNKPTFMSKKLPHAIHKQICNRKLSRKKGFRF